MCSVPQPIIFTTKNKNSYWVCVPFINQKNIKTFQSSVLELFKSKDMKPYVENTNSSVRLPPVCDLVLADFHEMQYRSFYRKL